MTQSRLDLLQRFESYKNMPVVVNAEDESDTSIRRTNANDNT